MSRRAFIVRPFGVKPVAGMGDVDFDEIQSNLIDPALRRLSINGRTTVDILTQGNIRDDMFHRLLTAELVIADISISNANVFYELGIRHALQDRHTLLIKFRVPSQKSVFDIAPERYFEYLRADYETQVDELVQRIERTLDEDRADSPVFQFLPNLVPQSRAAFLKLPLTFTENVETAVHDELDAQLGTFAMELQRFDIPWASRGLRTVADAQFRRKLWESARTTWEVIREASPEDLQANQRLATIYQKQAAPNLSRSKQAIDRALSNRRVTDVERAELLALRGSNYKTRWLQDWEGEAELEGRREAALKSRHLRKALEAYSTGFSTCLNHYYSGVNALSLSIVLTELAALCPECWVNQFDGPEAAEWGLRKEVSKRELLRSGLKVSLNAAGDSEWANVTRADQECLVGSSAAKVRQLYSEAVGGGSRQSLDSTARQLRILQQLGILEKNVSAALSAVESELQGREVPSTRPDVVVIFSGHRLDSESRVENGLSARFPARAEPQAKKLIREKLRQLQQAANGEIVAYAGAASGGDILFHEACIQLDIPSTVLLAGPPSEYVVASVQDSGGDWVQRFNELIRLCPVLQLTADLKLPRWLRGIPDFNLWQHNNIWTLNQALIHGDEKVVLVALWDHSPGDGKGGTADMIQELRRRGGRCEILDARGLLSGLD